MDILNNEPEGRILKVYPNLITFQKIDINILSIDIGITV